MQKLKIVASKTAAQVCGGPSATAPVGETSTRTRRDVLTRTRPMKSATNDADEIADAAIATMRELRAAATMIQGFGSLVLEIG